MGQTGYINALIDSLQKKIMLLNQIIEKNEEQYDIAKAEKFDMERFDLNTQNKGHLIKEIEKLDEGFEIVYDRVKEELTEHREQYKSQIELLQTLISVVTNKGVQIQASEARNKTLIENHFKFARQELQKSRVSTKAASSYYKSMNETRYAAPQMMDHKK